MTINFAKKSNLFLTGACTTLFLGCLYSTDSSKSESEAAMALRSPGSGSSETKHTICHLPPGNPANGHTISIGASAVDAHLAHGDKLGQCPDPFDNPCLDKAPPTAQDSVDKQNGKHTWKVSLCHIPPGNPANAHTISVGAAAVRAHIAHGDKIGSCRDPKPVDCGKDGGAGGGSGGDGGTGGGTVDGEIPT
jgi:hypothetical protein